MNEDKQVNNNNDNDDTKLYDISNFSI